MTSPIFFHELPIEQIKKMSEEDIEQTIKAEQLYYDNKPHTTYYLAVNGAKIKQGGLVKASSDVWKVRGLSVSRRLENGDEIIESPNTAVTIRIFKYEPLPEGFLNHE